MVIILMGPSGAGKTTIGRALAIALGWQFVEADDLHPPANIEKMRRGRPLSDADRAPWLDAVRQVVAHALEQEEPIVIACSALKRQYRDTIRDGSQSVDFVYLKADPVLLHHRLRTRPAHFAGPALVASQMATLEEPADEGLILDAAATPESIVTRIRHELHI